MTVEFLVEGHLLFKVALFKVVGLFLELLKGVQASLLETELTVSNETSCAVPFGIWLSFQWWIKACWMVGMVAGFANEQRTSVLALSTGFAFLYMLVLRPLGPQFHLPRLVVVALHVEFLAPKDEMASCAIQPQWGQHLYPKC
jgi:hypothetical protein